MIKIKIPKLEKGGIIDIPIENIGVSPDEYIFDIFMTQKEMLDKIEHQKKVIDRLSRRIQNKNKKYRQLQAQKMPPTMFGREVVIVPDSIANKVMILNKDVIDLEGILKW